MPLRKDKVIKALENPGFKWRTIKGISAETQLSADDVNTVISALKGEIIRASINSADGQSLFTTRQHYQNKASLGEKLIRVIKNRAA
jgi:hypothetical protein